MSIIIDMDMPSCCRECPMAAVLEYWEAINYGVFCGALNGEKVKDLKKRPLNCPIIGEVKNTKG